MSKEQPDHHDADLLIKVYDLRREPVMRESRSAINSQFWPASYEDLLAVTKPDHPLNAAYRQTSTYWEMVYGMARHGIVHPEYWLENNGEGLLLFAKVAPHLARLREDVSPRSFRNAEWIATQSEAGRALFAIFRERVSRTLEARVPSP